MTILVRRLTWFGCLAGLLALAVAGAMAQAPGDTVRPWVQRHSPSAAAFSIGSWNNPPGGLPMGTEHQTYASDCMKVEVGYNIYFPPQYEAQKDTRFPVVYWLHGLGGNENSDLPLATVLDQAIRSSRAPPMLLVLVNGGTRTRYNDAVTGSVKAETTIIRELIPHIDQRWRTLGSRQGRAIQGVSMGGQGALRLAFKYPELFGSVFAFAPALLDGKRMGAMDPAMIDALFDGDSNKFDKATAFAIARENAARIRDLPIAFVCGTAAVLLPRNESLHQELNALSVSHNFKRVEGVAHSLEDLLTALGPWNFEFASRHFAAPFSAGQAPPESLVKAFPTAEGFGAKAIGGRGGRIIEVTNLEDSGQGSLRAAMEASGPRICVFRLSGTITLKRAIQVHSPYLTVAGQTSPGGVQIRGDGNPEGDWGVWFVNGAHDIIVRYLRVRMGGNMKHDAGNNLLCYGTAEPGVHDVIFDHCSVSWGSDTQLDWYGSYLDRATFQWNIIGECFMGQHIGGNKAPKNITLHHNLYANLGSRTPLMQHASFFDFRNNVIYNWTGNNASVFGQFALNTCAFGNVVGNLWLAGPESGYPYLNVGNGGPVRIDGSPARDGGTRLYLAGNWGPNSPAGSTNDWTGHGVNTWDYYELNHDGSTHLVNQAQYDAARPFPAPAIVADRVSKLLDKVLDGVGACKPSRDPIDRRIVKSVREKTGSSRISTTGPWPDLATGAPSPPLDSDHDGMPDAWEKAHGLDPRDGRDGAATARNGYTNLENYLNELAGDPIP